MIHSTPRPHASASACPPAAALTPTVFDRVPTFHFVSLEGRRILDTASESHHFQPGDWIVREGEEGGRMFVLLEGRATVLKRAASVDTLVATLRANATIGEMCLIEERPRSASVRAVDPCRCASLSAGTLRRFGEFWPRDHAALVAALIRVMGRRLRLLDQQRVPFG